MSQHLSLFELLDTPEFNELGQIEDDVNQRELQKQVAKQVKITNAARANKTTENNYILFKFRWVDEIPAKQNLLPDWAASTYNKTTIAQTTTDKFSAKFEKGKYPIIERTSVAPIGVIFYLQDNKVVAEVLQNAAKYKIKTQITITTEPDKKGFTHTGLHRLELIPVPYASQQDDYCWSMTFVEPMVRIPLEPEGYELIPAPVHILKGAANCYGANETRDKDNTMDKFHQGEDGFENVNTSSFTAFYKKEPVQPLQPRHNVYDPRDSRLPMEKRRLIASFKTIVRCFQEHYDVCPDCKISRLGWTEDQEHECLDVGPANPSMRRQRQKEKLKFKKGKRMPWQGFKKRARGEEQEEELKMPEYKEREALFKPQKRRKEREVRVNADVLYSLQTKHTQASEATLIAICEGVMRLSKEAGERGDSLEVLQKALPTIDPELVKDVVTSIMDFPPESNLGKRERDTTSTNNMYTLLQNEEPEPELALSHLTQASDENLMITTPKKGSVEEIQFINKND
jgi:hypothetical protein